MRESFTADLHSLAFMRISISLLIIIDLFIRWSDLGAFYSNEGLFPVWLAKGFNPYLFSFFYLSESLIFHHALFLSAIISALLLCIGFKTKITTFTTWILLLSIHNRNILVNDGGDNIILLVLVWALFLPWGLKYSVDSFFTKTKNPSTQFASLSTLGLFTQIGLIYFTTAIHKRSNEWITEGSGVYYALSIGHFETPFGHFLLSLPFLLYFLNYAVLLLELIAPFALFWPIKNHIFRTLSIFVLISMHLGFGMGLTLGTFTFVMPIALLGLLPSWFWEKITSITRLNSKIKTANSKLKKGIVYQISDLSNIPVLLLIIYVVFLNIFTLFPLETGANSFYQLNKVLSLSQDWRFFGPKPYDYGLWFVTVGKLSNKEEVDVLTNNRPSFNRPEYISKLYKNQRWRNFLDKLHLYKLSFEPYAEFLCNHWNQKNSSKITSLEIYALTEKNVAATKSRKVNKEMQVDYTCSN